MTFAANTRIHSAKVVEPASGLKGSNPRSGLSIVVQSLARTAIPWSISPLRTVVFKSENRVVGSTLQ